MRHLSVCQDCEIVIGDPIPDQRCPECWGTNIGVVQHPETAADVATLRADYNRRHATDPDFTPSVPYDRNGNPITN
jgi:hypothetical protein